MDVDPGNMCVHDEKSHVISKTERMAQEEIRCISHTENEHCREKCPEEGSGKQVCKSKANENKYSLQA